MFEIKYERPEGIEEISELKKRGGVLFSGGTDVFVKMRKGVLKPKLLVDTKGLKTPKVECDSEKLTVYMNATYADLLDSGCLKDFPVLESIVRKVGSKQIRNRGTPVGNVGNASPAGDFLLSTYLYDAEAVIAPSMRRVHVGDLVKGPGKLDLKDEEFVHRIEFKKLGGYDFYFEKMGKRNALVISIASIGVLLRLDGDTIEDIRIAYGSVGPTVVRFEDIEAKMRGMEFSRETFEKFAREYERRVNPITDIRATKEYRKILVRNLLLKSFFSLNDSRVRR